MKNISENQLKLMSKLTVRLWGKKIRCYNDGEKYRAVQK